MIPKNYFYISDLYAIQISTSSNAQSVAYVTDQQNVNYKRFLNTIFKLRSIIIICLPPDMVC